MQQYNHMPTKRLGLAPEMKYYRYPCPAKPQGRGRAAAAKTASGKIRKWVYTSEETRQYQEIIAKATQIQNPFPFSSELMAMVLIHASSDTGDTDNILKALFDGMAEGKAFVNDRKIKPLYVEFNSVESGKELIEVILIKRNSEWHQIMQGYFLESFVRCLDGIESEQRS